LPTLIRPERLVVDANPILSALMGGQARRIFFESGIQEFAVPGAVLDEVRKYVPRLASKLNMGHEFLHYALDLLPMTAYSLGMYRHAMPEARRQIAKRDPNDVDVLALAITLKQIVWTNDRDFEVAKIQRVTTAELPSICFPKR
jgi:predicted nucleic acid-binding protein